MKFSYLGWVSLKYETKLQWEKLELESVAKLMRLKIGDNFQRWLTIWWQNRQPTSPSCHQHISSQTYVTKIDLTLVFFFDKKCHFDKISTHHNFKNFEFLALILISNSDFDQEINIYFQPKKCWFSGSIQHPYFHFRLFRDSREFHKA